MSRRRDISALPASAVEQLQRANARHAAALEAVAQAARDRHRAVLSARTVGGLSLADVAAVLGVTRAAVQAIERRGNSPEQACHDQT